MKKTLIKIAHKFKALIATLIIFSLIGIIIDNNVFELKTKIYKKYPNLSLRKHLFKSDSVINNLINDYNVKFLPHTQFIKMNLSKKTLIFDKNYYSIKYKASPSIGYSKWGTFFLENYKNKLVVTDYMGNIYYYDNLKEAINSTKKKLKLNKIVHDINPRRVFDTLLHNQKLYVGYTTDNNGCKRINVSVADFNTNSLKFKKFFSPSECNKTGGIGKMQFYIHQKEPGILVSTEEGIHDSPGTSSQKDDSVFGKIIFINLKNLNYFNFSKGHRVAQGLYANKDLILATEHGPKGGDEINKIIYKKNYGWPIASYGERYDFEYGKKPHYQKNHESLNFEEPIYATAQGIGISEILMLPKKFSNFFDKDILAVSTLADKSIYFANFDKDFNRIITLEKIFLNDRIRDLKYHKETSSILLAFEENGELGILSSKN
jgi:hypothetical protein